MHICTNIEENILKSSILDEKDFVRFVVGFSFWPLAFSS